ncbi:MAG: DUF192 domain-containing protein, partial [Acidobacteria bacterium]|nr:DUF192 domain-containing protein [Acidobacteriota bacterium]
MRALMLALIAMLAACQRKEADLTNLRVVTLPGGHQIYAEVMLRREDMARGMMFRTSLAENRGLLFLHGRPGRYPYWMHNVQVPLDIIWMDKEHRIVEISARTPACLESDPA